jgi:hypothetical protein
MSFIQKALEITEKGFGEVADAAEEAAAHHHAAKLFLKLGVAVYAEQRLDGSHDPVDRVLSALDGFVAEHGEDELDHLRAAHEVLGKEFIAEHETATADA